MALFSTGGKITGSLIHNMHGTIPNEAGEMIANVTQQTIKHNKGNPTNWVDNMSNGPMARSAREKVLMSPESPSTATTQGQRYANYAGHRGQIGQAQENLRGNITNLESELAAFQTSKGAASDIAATTTALGNARRELSQLGTQKLTSYGKQAGSHVKRLGQWTQEGGFKDRAIKTAAVGGTYAGANFGMRALSGGGATYNNNGERDIMGIPFV